MITFDWEWRSIPNHGDIWVEQDANARAYRYFYKKGKLTENQLNAFQNQYPGRYDNSRFFRNWFFPFFQPFYLLSDWNTPY